MPLDPARYYDITTTATYSGLVEICISYEDEDVIEDESELALYHHEDTIWRDITTSLDTDNNILCGQTSSLSPFVITQPLVTGLAGTNDDLPDEFSLSQNYPNPFNPNTEIQFALPRAGQVKLGIYNIIGQRVVTLVDGFMAAGYHRVMWDSRNSSGKDVASGIYLYKLEAGDFVRSRKMLLLK